MHTTYFIKNVYDTLLQALTLFEYKYNVCL